MASSTSKAAAVVPTPVTTSNAQTSVAFTPTVCKQDQFGRWLQKWPWLQGKHLINSVHVGVCCTTCASVSSLKTTAFVTARVEVEATWISGVTAKSSKKLHDKITEHCRSKTHKLCEAQLELRKKETIKHALQTSADIFKAQNREKIEVTSRIFNTAYTIARKNISFRTHPALIDLQTKNGLDMGKMLFSDHSCSNVILFIADSMCKQLAKFVLDTDSFFSLLMDESTTYGNQTTLIVYLRFTGPDGEPCNGFLTLIELEGTKGVDIANALYSALTQLGFTSSILAARLLGFCTDGASNLHGAHQGAIQLFLEKIGRSSIVKHHCMNHKLELIAHKVVDDVKEMLHFRQFVDTLHAYFSQSPKNGRALEVVAAELHVVLLKIGRIFDVRWLSSSYRSINAVWQSLPALLKLFQGKTTDSTAQSKDRAKATGMVRKMQSWAFVFELALLRDALEILQQLSLFLQRRDATICNVRDRLQTALNLLIALKTTNGLSLSQITSEYDKDGTVRGLPIEMPTEQQKTRFPHMRCQFLQGLVDHLRTRFPEEDLLQAGAALDPDTWPVDELQKAFFGDREVIRLAEICQIITTVVLDEFRQYKNNVRKIGPALKTMLHRVQLIPISSSECERGFSCMNLDDTAIRNRLEVSTLSALVFIKVNGPPLELFPAETYAIEWIQSGRHAAIDQPTGKKKKDARKTCSSVGQLFATRS
jgi:hypothetical protein